MTITYDDFKDWKSSPVTRALFAGWQARISDLCETLGVVAGEAPLEDRYKAGYIQALRDVLAVEHEGALD